MTHITLPSGEWMLVKVPTWAKDIKSYHKPLVKLTMVDWLDEDENYVYPVHILGNWQLHGSDPLNLTEEEAGELFTYTAWLIEMSDVPPIFPSLTQWAAFGLNNHNYNQIGWTSDAFKAIKFNTQEEAQNIIDKYIDFDDIIITEHLFYDFEPGLALESYASLLTAHGHKVGECVPLKKKP